MIADSHHFDEVFAALKRRPFEPFSIRLVSGKRYEIGDWRAVAVAKGSPRVVVLVDDGRSYDFFNWGDVAAVEMNSQTA